MLRLDYYAANNKEHNGIVLFEREASVENDDNKLDSKCFSMQKI